MINILSQSVNRHVILVGPDGVGKRTLAYSLGLLMSEGKGPTGLKNLVQIDETALLDSDQKAIRAGLSQAAGGILFIPHIHRFFGGPIKAEFAKATPMIQKAFLADDPVIIGTTTEQELYATAASVSAMTEHSQIIRVPEPQRRRNHRNSQDDEAAHGSGLQPQVAEDALALAVRLAKRYLTASASRAAPNNCCTGRRRWSA